MQQIRILPIFLLLLWISGFLLGCGGKNQDDVSAAKEITVTDNAGRSVTLPHPVTRAAVANRYNMEVIQSLGVLDRVCGVDYGIYQDRNAYGEFAEDQVIGTNQRTLNYERIIELHPEVLILPDNGAWEDAEKKLSPFGIKVIVMNPYYTDHFEELYRLAGTVFGREQEADAFIRYFKEKLDYIETQLAGVPRKRVYYEYKKPGWTTVPGDYFYKMVELAGGDNIFSDAVNTHIDIEAVVERNPDAIIKVGEDGAAPQWQAPGAEELMARKQRLAARPGWDHIKAVQDDHVLIMSQYVQGGAAKIIGTLYIAKFLYPEQLPDLHPEDVFRYWVERYQHKEYQPGHTLPAFPLTGECRQTGGSMPGAGKSD